MRTASLGTLGLSWSATWRHWAFALSASSWAKAVATKAETTRRPWRPAWASRLRAKCTRHLCQVAPRIRVAAAFRPLWSSEITSFTPRSPRRARERRNSVQKVSASDAPIAIPSTSRRPWSLTATATVTATETMRPASRTFT